MKTILTLALTLVAIVGGLVAWDWYSWHRLSRGYEVKAAAHSSYLKTMFSEDLGYRGFNPGSLQKAWMNGFQDHTYLFLVLTDTSDLKNAIEKVAGTEPISASYFRDGSYLGPSIAPNWWNTKAIDSVDARFFQKDSRLWRFTWIDGRLYIVLSVA